MILVDLFTSGCSGKAVKNNNEQNANKAEEALWLRTWETKDVMTVEVF